MDSPPVLFELGSSSASRTSQRWSWQATTPTPDATSSSEGARDPRRRVDHEVHNHHNFAWREEHFGRAYWVIRKGCTPARPGQEGFVGGSMGDESVILEGVESPENDQALYSTVHGAGRVMSRSQAAGRVRRRKRTPAGTATAIASSTLAGLPGPPRGRREEALGRGES